MVAGRSRSSGNAPTGAAAFAGRAAGVLVDGVCVYVCRFVVVCGCLQLFVVLAVTAAWYCCCCGCGLWFVVVAVCVDGAP